MLAWIAIYALIAVLFHSHTQPLIVMAVMPFGFIGAVVGHVLLGHALSLHSVVGSIAAISLLLVPVGYLIQDDLRGLLWKLAQLSQLEGISRREGA